LLGRAPGGALAELGRKIRPGEIAWEFIHLENDSREKKNLREANMRARIAEVIFLASTAIGIVLAASLGFAAPGSAAEYKPAGQAEVKTIAQTPGPSYLVTPVFGPSWLKHLGIFDIRWTAMGQMGGLELAPRSPRQEPNFPVEVPPPRGRGGRGMGGMMGQIYSNYPSKPSEVARLMDEKFLLAGIDLYRLNCQSCHGPRGEGAPPEIKSLVGPVKASSPALVQERMKKMGRPIDEALAKELAAQAEASIRERLRQGGKKMPPFGHLDKEEINALLQSLRDHIGGLRPETKEILVPQSVARVGEHLMKGTCHICHDATGPGRGRMGMMQGNIPSLASFPWEQSMPSLVRQVELGTVPMMMMGGQRMPAYPYITEDEAAASYLYLLRYPPY
jgi:mono/diheme cytochrome c family protein